MNIISIHSSNIIHTILNTDASNQKLRIQQNSLKKLQLRKQNLLFLLKQTIINLYFLMKSLKRKQSNKNRSFPPTVPLKMNKLLQYQYFTQIYQKYDCNFFRQIIPYFSEIVTTDKLQLSKYVYVPIQNPKRVPKIHIGMPFYPQNATEHTVFHELENQVTFIKIAYQIHTIFEYLIKINMTTFKIGRLKFQDKFWLFTEGVIRSYNFNQIVYKKDQPRAKAITFILCGEFKCLNRQNKPYKTISRGYAIDSSNKVRKLQFEDKLNSISNNNNNNIKQQSLSCQQNDNFYSLLSFSNIGRILVIDLSVVKKYSLIEDFLRTGKQTPKPNEQQPLMNKIELKNKMSSSMMMKQFSRTQTLQNQKSTTNNIIQQQQQRRSQYKKSTLFQFHSRPNSKNRYASTPVQQIYQNEIVKSYTKQSELYQRIKKAVQFKKNNKNISIMKFKQSHSKQRSKLLPFFTQQLQDERQKLNMKRKKSKQLWSNVNIHYESESNLRVMNQTFLEQLTRSIQQPKTSNSYQSQQSVNKLRKSQLGSFNLLKRNLCNKAYHKLHQSQTIH